MERRRLDGMGEGGHFNLFFLELCERCSVARNSIERENDPQMRSGGSWGWSFLIS